MQALSAGDTLLLADGGSTDVLSLARETLANPVAVYNLEVEGYHTYFVATAGVWVHNDCGMQPGAESFPEGRLTTDQPELFKHLEEYHGIDQNLASERLHALKAQVDIGGRNVVFGWSGDVYNPVTGEHLGSLTQGGAGPRW